MQTLSRWATEVQTKNHPVSSSSLVESDLFAPNVRGKFPDCFYADRKITEAQITTHCDQGMQKITHNDTQRYRP